MEQLVLTIRRPPFTGAARLPDPPGKCELGQQIESCSLALM